jgi:hypothetical protein
MPGRKKALITRLVGTIQHLAGRTWDDLRDSDRLGLSLSEESITDFLLLHLARKYRNEIVIEKYSKAEEGYTTGADWEWWFGARAAWVGIRVQAKKLSEMHYANLGHFVRGTKRKQYNLLIKSATRDGLYPVYCFYNYWPIRNIRLGLPALYRGRSRYQGWSVADAILVRRMVMRGIDDLREIAKISMPIDQLFTRLPGTAAATLTSRVFESVSALAASTTSNQHRPLVVPEPPDYVTALLAASSVADPLRRRYLLSDKLDIDGVMIAYDDRS